MIDSLGTRTKTAVLKGEYKKLPNSPSREDGSIHEYCPPVHVALEMEKLVGFHKEHERLGVPPEVEAAWLHHRFTQIHPFQDGNGRVAWYQLESSLDQLGSRPLTFARFRASASVFRPHSTAASVRTASSE